MDGALACSAAGHHWHHRVAFHEIGVQLEFESTVAVVDQRGPDQREVRPLAGTNNVLGLLFRARVVRGAGIDYRGRGDVDEMPHLRCFRCRDHVACALDVDRAEQLGLLAQQDRGQMIDDIDPHERPGQGRGLGDVAVVDLSRITQAAHQRIPRQNQRPHAMALLVEPMGHAGADFARSTRDENGHWQEDSGIH